MVDLHFLDSPARHHIRYLDRVCNSVEACLVRRSAKPWRSLSVIWACKEAAFKLMSKESGRRSFVPWEFETHFEARTELDSNGSCLVTRAGAEAIAMISVTEDWVHAVATRDQNVVVHWAVREIDKCPPQTCPSGSESEAVRFLARQLLSNYGRSDTILEFIGRVPRLRRRNGDLAEMGISLSHHGAFAGAAIAWASGQRQPCDHSKEGTLSEENCSTCTV